MIDADNGKGGPTIKFVSVFVIDNRLIKSYQTNSGNLCCRLGNDF